MSDMLDRLIAECAWGQVRPGGPFHAFDRAWWDPDNRWVQRCNRRADYGDLQLVTLDVEPGGTVCANERCQSTLRAHRRVLAPEGDQQ